MKKKRALAASRIPDDYDTQMVDGGYVIRDPAQQTNVIAFNAGGDSQNEMLRISPNGFWVRGVKVEQDEHEAQAVYEAFKQWMSWNYLERA